MIFSKPKSSCISVLMGQTPILLNKPEHVQILVIGLEHPISGYERTDIKLRLLNQIGLSLDLPNHLLNRLKHCFLRT